MNPNNAREIYNEINRQLQNWARPSTLSVNQGDDVVKMAEPMQPKAIYLDCTSFAHLAAAGYITMGAFADSDTFHGLPVFRLISQSGRRHICVYAERET